MYCFIFFVVLPPVITSQPSNVTLVTGQTAVFIVEAFGRNLDYQWFAVGGGINGGDQALSNMGNIHHTTLKSLVIINVTQASHGGASFYVKVSNKAGVVISNPVTITIG